MTPNSYMCSLLTLDHTTLFYWTLSGAAVNKKSHSSAIKKWASAVPHNEPPSQAHSVASHTRITTPSLTSGASRSSAPSVLTDNVKIIQAPDVVKVKSEPVPTVFLDDNGGLSDNNEMKGEEHEVTIKSPPKGKKRITSEVHCLS